MLSEAKHLRLSHRELEEIPEILRVAQDDNCVSGAWDLDLCWLLFSFVSSFESSFAVHIKIFHGNLVGFAIGSDGKGNAASANSVLARSLVGEYVAVVMLHRESFDRHTSLQARRAQHIGDRISTSTHW